MRKVLAEMKPQLKGIEATIAAAPIADPYESTKKKILDDMRVAATGRRCIRGERRRYPRPINLAISSPTVATAYFRINRTRCASTVR